MKYARAGRQERILHSASSLEILGDLTMIRANMINVDAFIDVVGTENCEGTIDMDLLNYKRVNGTLLKCCWVVNDLEDLVTRFLVTEYYVKLLVWIGSTNATKKRSMATANVTTIVMLCRRQMSLLFYCLAYRAKTS
jgi:hypothetical protein